MVYRAKDLKYPWKCVTGVGLRWQVVGEMTGWFGSSVVECLHGQRKALGSSPGRATIFHLLQLHVYHLAPRQHKSAILTCQVSSSPIWELALFKKLINNAWTFGIRNTFSYKLLNVSLYLFCCISGYCLLPYPLIIRLMYMI